MNGFPAELVYALIFAAVLLVQYLMKRSGAWPRPDDAAQDAPTAEAQPAEQGAPVPARWGSKGDVRETSWAAAERIARIEVRSASAATARRRTSARSPLGNGQDLRRAVVGMTLLGPCRAQEPP